MINVKEDSLKNLNSNIMEEHSDKELVLGSGNINSSIILVGEAPGSKEVQLKKPFVGQAGKHLEEFLEILEIGRNEVYITNAVKFRPTRKSPKTNGLINRPPTKKEIEFFRKYLIDEISIINPKMIVTLGNTPLKSIFEEDIKIGEVHGKLYEVNIKDEIYKVFPLYHPAAVIYRRELRGTYIEDLKKLKELIH
ncbi:uracil-DNA glycosylase [Anaerosalibacter bizertensis]|uniref:uracil-DNA glycosylase n=1 Tax=Anaerosalibacter bizertensis TaxID=932217 RepID=UPI001D02698F|nr:uracil-DNA glycosylase [Anaerosalibacter bizertensis]